MSDDDQNPNTTTNVRQRSDAKILELARAEAAPTANILGGGPAPGPDPDDLEAAVVNQDYLLKAGSDKVPQPAKIRKPGKDYFRAFPHYQIFNLHADEIEGKIDKNYYFVMPQMAAVMEGETFECALVLCVNSYGIEFFWPVRKLDGDDSNRWISSAWTAVKLATENWVKMRANQKPGAGYYDTFTAKGDLGEPEFTVKDAAGYMALLKGATPPERKILTSDHPIISKVEGRRK